MRNTNYFILSLFFAYCILIYWRFYFYFYLVHNEAQNVYELIINDSSRRQFNMKINMEMALFV